MTVVGVSLKMYFGFQQTLEWCRDIARLVGDRASSPALEMFVLPAFPALPDVRRTLDLTGIGVGAQDLAAEDAGAQTGEVGGSMIAELGCRYVEVGHAERRRLFAETETVVAAKTAAALRHGLVPILCVGEVSRQPAASAATECRRQLDSALSAVADSGLGGRLVVAYEPHWAIGTPEPAPADHITEVCGALRRAALSFADHPGSSVIYGGSAGPGLFSRIAAHVDGLFLGRFAHDPAALASVLDEVTAAQTRQEVQRWPSG